MPQFRALSQTVRRTCFPQWAPATLVEAYFRMWQAIDDRKEKGKPAMPFVFFMPHEQEVSLLGELISDPQMQAVWVALEKRAAIWDENHAVWRAANERLRRRVSFEHGFFGFVTAAVVAAAQTPSVTKAEASTRRAALAEQIRTLKRDLLRAYGDGIMEQVSLTEVLDPKGWDGYKVALGIEEEKTDYMTFWFEEYLGDTWDALERFAVLVETTKAIDPPPQAGSQLSKHRHFVRRVSRSMSDKFGSPLHDHVATIATVVTGHEFSRDDVRQLIDRDKDARD